MLKKGDKINAFDYLKLQLSRRILQISFFSGVNECNIESDIFLFNSINLFDDNLSCLINLN